MEPRHILVYNDSPVFGGHEFMTIEMANALTKDFRVSFYFYHQRIGQMLDPAVVRHQIPVQTKFPLGGVRSLNPLDLGYLYRRLKRLRPCPDLVLVSQGTIEMGLKGALVAKLLGYQIVSYLPLAFSFAEMRVGLGGLRDKINILFYNLFDGIITISAEQQGLIKANLPAFSRKPIPILENFVATQAQSGQRHEYPSGREASGGGVSNCRQDGVTEGKAVIGLIGRIEFRQKGQEKAVEIARALKARGARFEMQAIGDGVDRNELLKKIAAAGVADVFTLRGWIEKPEDIYQGLSLVLITSNFEGVPLTLLEAVMMGVPVIAPASGVFKEYLDPAFLYGKIEEAALAIERLLQNRAQYAPLWQKLRAQVAERHSRQLFEKKLLQIMNGFLNVG